MEKWLTVQELLGLETLPKSDRGITKKADRENWVKRQREGVKGKHLSINSVPYLKMPKPRSY